MAEEVGCVLGHLVGYCVRFDGFFDKERTKIKVMNNSEASGGFHGHIFIIYFQFLTDGILMREIMSDPLLSNYRHTSEIFFWPMEVIS